MPAFNAYVMVDWSAANVAASGPDSIWICALVRSGDRLRRVMIENPRTRTEAVSLLIAFLAGNRYRTLVGFDFPFGYPSGTADRLVPGDDAPWTRIWSLLAREIVDEDDNRNNRFAVAASLNRRMSASAFPFWGCARSAASEYLSATRFRRHGPGDFCERRLCEKRARRTQPVWKLAYPGAVGSQTLLGIPRVWKIRNHASLASETAIWPFETGLRDSSSTRCILAEIYPSLATKDRMIAAAGELVRDGRPAIKDAMQVIAFARTLAEDDEAGLLDGHLRGDPVLNGPERIAVESEEAWILGVKPLNAFTGNPP